MYDSGWRSLQVRWIFFSVALAYVVFELREGAISPAPPPWPYLIVKNTLIWESLLCLAVSQCLRVETLYSANRVKSWCDLMCSNLTSQFVTGSYLYLFPKLRARPCKETRFQKGKDCLRTSNLEGISDICMRIYVYVYIYTNHINILVFSKCRCFKTFLMIRSYLKDFS